MRCPQHSNGCLKRLTSAWGRKSKLVYSQTKQHQLLSVLEPYIPCQYHTMVCVHSTSSIMLQGTWGPCATR
ncbi:hypothetical protein LINPERPRIM_LOCUS30278 [Linum perenne]